MERLFSDDGLEREFVERGYTVVPLLDQGDIEALSALNESTTVPQSRDFHPATPDFFATTLSPDTDKRRQVSDGIAAIVHDRLRLVVPGYRICFATFVYKIARSQRGHVPLHQDWWITDNMAHRAAHFWCPLIDVDEQNGCLWVVPGIHRMLDTPYPVDPSYRTRFHPVLKIIQNEYAIPVPMKAGSALVYDQRMLHGSQENSADIKRVAVNCAVLPQNLPAHLYYPDDTTPERLQLFEVPDSYLCGFEIGGRIGQPYPNSVRRLDAVEISSTPLQPEDLKDLRCHAT